VGPEILDVIITGQTAVVLTGKEPLTAQSGLRILKQVIPHSSVTDVVAQKPEARFETKSGV